MCFDRKDSESRAASKINFACPRRILSSTSRAVDEMLQLTAVFWRFTVGVWFSFSKVVPLGIINQFEHFQ
jgi:hypothetical protein